MGDRRIFLIVLDGFGIGAMPDAIMYGDEGSNTLRSVSQSKALHIPNLVRLGLGNITGVEGIKPSTSPTGCYGRIQEKSAAKDTTAGHWEIAGVVTNKPFPTYPNGFPEEIINEFEKLTGRKVIVNKPMSGTEVIAKYGEEHINTGALIVYTSADSVFQIAAHEEVLPPEELYHFCETARELLRYEHSVARVIARPFTGKVGDFRRTAGRKDFSLAPPKGTVLDILTANGIKTISIGKIYDIFAGRGISESFKTKSNDEGMERVISLVRESFSGLVFVNLVDFDMQYGHRNDIEGYAKALSSFDRQLGAVLRDMGESDVIIITADHGCDPGFTGTDHTREYVPLICYGTKLKNGVDLRTRESFADIAMTVLDYFNLKDMSIAGQSFLNEIAE